MATTTNYNLPLILSNEYDSITVAQFIEKILGQGDGTNTNYSAMQLIDTELYKKARIVLFSNKQINISDFVSDNTYSDYSYKIDIVCTDVTSNDLAEVILNLTEAVSGNYAPVCTTGTDKVTIYAKAVPSSGITIPTIKVLKGGA